MLNVKGGLWVLELEVSDPKVSLDSAAGPCNFFP